MRKTSIAIPLALASALGGCATVQPSADKDLVSVSVVLDKLKDELYAFSNTDSTVIPRSGVCYAGPHPIPMNLVPLRATATLKTVASRENDPTLGLAVPLGAFAFAPSLGGAYSKKQTQTIVIPLAVQLPPKKANDQTPTQATTQVIVPGPLATALSNFRDEILKVDHDKYPCLQYVSGSQSNFKLSIAFDVVGTTTLGIGLQLAVFKIGDKEILSSEGHQTLDIELGLTPADTFLLNAPYFIDPARLEFRPPVEAPSR